MTVGVVAASVLAALAVGDIVGYVASGSAAATAADAAALAAAPLTFREFGTSATPTAEARRFAALNGAELVACDCSIDRSWNPRTVEVVVARTVHFALFGDRVVHALGRARFVPTNLH